MLSWSSDTDNVVQWSQQHAIGVGTWVDEQASRVAWTNDRTEGKLLTFQASHCEG